MVRHTLKILQQMPEVCLTIFKRYVSKDETFVVNNSTSSQVIFTCSKSTTETLEKKWNVFKVTNKNTRTTWFYCKLWTYFTPFSSVSIVYFEQMLLRFLEYVWSFFDPIHEVVSFNELCKIHNYAKT